MKSLNRDVLFQLGFSGAECRGTIVQAQEHIRSMDAGISIRPNALAIMLEETPDSYILAIDQGFMGFHPYQCPKTPWAKLEAFKGQLEPDFRLMNRKAEGYEPIPAQVEEIMRAFKGFRTFEAETADQANSGQPWNRKYIHWQDQDRMKASYYLKAKDRRYPPYYVEVVNHPGALYEIRLGVQGSVRGGMKCDLAHVLQWTGFGLQALELFRKGKIPTNVLEIMEAVLS